MKKVRLIIASILAMITLFGVAMPVYAIDTKQAVCDGVGLAGGSNCSAPAGQPDVQGTVQKVIIILSMIVAVIAIIMIMIGGLKYITSAGDSAKVSSAKDTILYSVIGLAIALLAQVIVRFVVNRLT